MKKLANFLLLAVITACATGDSVPDIVQVCVNYGTFDSYCGTGFFVAPDRLVTTLHITEESNDGTLRVLRMGGDIETDRIYNIPNTEIVVAVFDEEIIEPTADICDSVRLDTQVDVIGVLDWKDGPEWLEGTIFQTAFGYLWITGTAKPGYSGGPTFDIENKCYNGTTKGHSEAGDYIVASNITIYKDVILGPEELIETEDLEPRLNEREPDFDDIEILLLSE